MPTARPMMFASASGELKTRVAPKRRCRPCVTLKTPPLPGHRATAPPRAWRRRRPRRTSTMRGLRAISSRSVRLIAATIVSGLPAGCGRRLEGRGRRIDVGREDPAASRVSFARLRRLQRAVGRLVHLALDLGRDPLQLGLRRQLVARAGTAAKHANRIALGLGLALLRRLVQLLVVRERVRVGPDDVRVHERRAAPLARVRRPPRASPGGSSRKSVPSTVSTSRFGNARTIFEMSPPGVCTSTGTEIA